MKLASVRLVTRDLDRLIPFYSMLTGVSATRLAPEFAEVRLEGAVLALRTDVDGVRARLGGAPFEHVMPPTTQPGGNRSMLLRDPDGNLVNVFSRPAA